MRPLIETCCLAAALLGLPLVLPSPGQAELADRLECVPHRSTICSFDGCHEDDALTLRLHIDVPRRLYQRCEPEGCEAAKEMTVQQRGDYLTMTHGDGLILSIQTEALTLKNIDFHEPAGSFADVKIEGVATIQNFGQCSRKR